MSFTSAYRTSLLIGAAAVLATGSAHAQTASATGESTAEQMAAADTAGDITVTGLRQQYRGDLPLKELPQSIQTLSGETLREMGITRLDTALDFASGVARQNNFGGLFDSFAIRGFSGDENTASNYLLNGFNASRGYGGIRDTSNVERIEILKGPSSALFGRGEPGGTINIITKKPQFDAFGASATFAGGSYNTYRGEADINAPLADNLAFRVTGAYEEGDSFRDYIHTKKYTATPSILWKIAPDTTFSYELEYVRQELPFDRGVVAVNGDLKAISRKTFLGEPGDGDVKVNALGHQAQLQHNFSRDWSVLIGVGYRDTTFKGYSSEAELTAGRQAIYANGTQLSRQRRYRDYETTDQVVRGEVSGKLHTGPFVHHLLIGADYDDYQLDTIQLRYRPPVIATQLSAANIANLAIGNRIDIFNPVYGNLPAVAAFQNQRERQFSFGVYAQDQIDLTDKLKLRLGGRYDYFEQTIDFRLTQTRAEQTKKKFSPQVGLAYVLADALTLYTSYGKGFRPNTGTSASNTPFTPEQTESYEVGAKLSLLDDKLTGTIAAFHTKKTNVLTADPVNAGFSQALGKARSQGIETELSGQLPAGFRVNLTYSYTDAEVAKDAIDANFGFTLRKGDPLINIPKHSGSALLFKDFTFGERKLTLGAGVNYVGKRLGETGFRFADGSFFTLPSYTLTRLTAAFEVNEHLRVSGEVTNLFDEKYFPSSYSRLWLTPGNPRQFMARIGYKL